MEFTQPLGLDRDYWLELTTNTVTQYVREDTQTIMPQSMIHGKYHGNTGYLLGNVDVGTQEFAGMGYCVDDGQTTWTDESQMMTSCGSHTSQLHKSITQTNCTKQDDVMSTNGNDERCFRMLQSNSGAYGAPETG